MLQYKTKHILVYLFIYSILKLSKYMLMYLFALASIYTWTLQSLYFTA